MDETSKPGDTTKRDASTPPPSHKIVQLQERLDDEGLPLDREPTMDDVRGEEGSGRTIAIGCTALVLLATLGFWLLRYGLMR
jgi:hypothetical protein